MKKEDNPKNKKQKLWLWPFVVLILALMLSFCFSFLSELTLSNASLLITIIVIVIFIALSILFDVVGLAVASANIEDFHAMASRKVKGAKQAISLIKNADRVSSVCNDVIGDVCGILSGAAGASIVTKIVIENAGNFKVILITCLVSAIISGLTIFGKASFKRVAITHCTGITLALAKFLNFFTRKG